MSKDLVPSNIDFSQLPATQVGSDKQLAELARGGDFLQRLQLYGKGKAIDKKLIAAGHYGVPVSKDEITDLGESIDLLVLARKPKAMDMNDLEALIINYDAESEEFQRIATKSAEKDSGCMYGVTFLVFERNTASFYEFYCGTKSTRSEAKKLYPYLPVTVADIKNRGLKDVEPHGPLPVTLKSRYVEKQKYSWFVPVVNKCSTPFTNVPPIEQVVKQITNFITMTGDGVEKVQEPTNKRAR